MIDFEELEKNAENGDDQSMVVLARHLIDGAILKMNIEKAKEWRRKADEKGNLVAKSMLHYHAFEVPQNFEKAFEFLSQFLLIPNHEERLDAPICFHELAYIYSEASICLFPFPLAQKFCHSSFVFSFSLFIVEGNCRQSGKGLCQVRQILRDGSQVQLSCSNQQFG